MRNLKTYKISYSDARGYHEVDFRFRKKYAENYFNKIIRSPRNSVKEVRLYELDLETEEETEIKHHSFVANING